MWQEHNRIEEMSRKHIALTEGVGRIMLFDESLTMSARLSAATGDFSYEKRYDQLDPQLTGAINALRAMLPEREIERFVRETDEANLVLVKMERRAFALTHQGRRPEAMTLLTSDEYARFKKVYAGGMQKTISAKNNLLERDIQHLRLLSFVSAAASTAAVIVLLATWFFAARSTRNWAAERVESEKVLRESRDELEVRVKQRTADLLNVNEELGNEISERKRAEEALHRSETKFRTLYDSTSDAVMLLDEKGFFDCNKATLTIFGCATREEFCSKHPADLSPPQQPCGTDSMTLANQRIATAMEKGSIHFEWMHKRNDTGETFPADVLLTAMELDGKPVVQAVVRDITERKHAEEKIRQMAYHDSLTGLPNRKLFSDRLGIALVQAQRNQKKVGIAMLDLDNFKAVNDTLGHEVGDLLLQATAERLSAALRKGDTIARFGGDEFVLIFPDLKGIEDAIRVAQKIVDGFCKPFLIDTHQLVVTTSIGIAAYPDDGTDEVMLLKKCRYRHVSSQTSGTEPI